VIGKTVEQHCIVDGEILLQDRRHFWRVRPDRAARQASHFRHVRIGDEMRQDVGADKAGRTSQDNLHGFDPWCDPPITAYCYKSKVSYFL
jgi:hypothetical protein